MLEGNVSRRNHGRAGIAAMRCLCATAFTVFCFMPAGANTSINSGNTVDASALGTSTSDTPNFNGGTLRIDTGTTVANNFTLGDVSTNTIDEFGHSVTMSGVFGNSSSTSSGGITYTDSVGGGFVTLTGVSSYTGATTIDTSARLALSGAGSIASSSGLSDNGVFDISQASSTVTISSLSGTGSVVLGSQTLNLIGGGTFSGVISGTGSLTLSGGSETLTGTNTYTGGTAVLGGTLQIGDGGASGSIIGNIATSNSGTVAFDRSDAITFSSIVTGSGGLTQKGAGSLTITAVNTYTGTTTISAGTLALSGIGSVSNSSSVAVAGTFDVSAASSGVSVKSLSGAGGVVLGNRTLTITAGSSTFSGTISGAGTLVVAGGNQGLAGANTYTGGTTITAGQLTLASGGSIIGGVTDNGILGFSCACTFNDVISGTGAVTSSGSTTLTAVETYTGTTTTTGGTLMLSGNASIASSSGLTDNGTFDISATSSGASITTLSGAGRVALGVETLTLTNASGTFSGTISGTGNLVIDAGTEALSGIDSYSGTTTIAGGKLALSANGSIFASRLVDNGVLDVSNSNGSPTVLSLAGSGNVSLGNQTLSFANAFDTFSGTIAGGGGLTLEAGSETLSGANTYLGVTTISQGTLALAGSGSIAASSSVADSGTFDISATSGGASIKSLFGSGTVLLGSQNLTITSAGGTFSGVISGAGGLTLSGGTEILSGTNTYSGGTTISAGTLQLGVGGTTGTIMGNVVDNGTLAFNYSSGTMAATISGSGTVVQKGLGTTVLTANNTYSGGTTISAGTLQLGAGGTQGSIAGNVVDNGALAFDRSDSIVFSGTISGTGGVSQIGTGTTTLTATETYSGATTISSGTLALSGTASLAASNVIDNGVFDITATSGVSIKSLSGAGSVAMGAESLTLTNASGDFSGVVSGTGGVTLAGGSEILAGANTYTGATTVTSGNLTVNGTIANSSNLLVSAGATLAGTGTVPTTVIASAATLAPGSGGPGTLNVAGSVTFANGSNYDVTVSSTAASKLVVSNTAGLAGKLSVTSSGGYLVGQELTVLTAASGLTGSFSLADATSVDGAFRFTLTQDSDNVFLRIDLANLSVLLPADASPNADAVAAGIDAAIAHGDALPSAIDNLGNLSGEDLATALEQLSGEVGSDLPAAERAALDPFLEAMISHDDSQMPPWRRSKKTLAQKGGVEVWVTAFGGAGKLDGELAARTHNLHTNFAGVIAGVDWKPSPTLSFGVAVSAAQAGIDLADGLGTGRDNAWQLGGYGLYRLSPHFFTRFAAALGWNQLKTERVVTLEGGEDLSGQANGFTAGGRVDLGVNLPWWGLTPYLAAQGVVFQNGAYSESGSSDLALHYAAHASSDTRLEAGLEKSGTLSVWDDGSLTLGGGIALARDIDSKRGVVASFESLSGSAFTVEGAQPKNNAALLSLSTLFQSVSGIGFQTKFDGEFTSRSQSYTGTAGVDFKW